MALKNNPEALNAIAFATRILELLDQGAYTTTYKFAVLIGLMDLVIEKSDKGSSLTDMVTTRQLAEKVVEIYWHHVGQFDAKHPLLLQGKSGQAEILGSIAKFRQASDHVSLYRARNEHKKKFEALIDRVEKKLIEMPLPRVQYFGGKEEPFIYQIGWSLDSPADLKQVTAYQKGESGFDNRIHLMPGVSDCLVNMNHLLRPLIHRTWAMEVAKINDLEDSQLESFLFGSKREPAAELTPDLLEFQEGRCFYCDAKFSNSKTNKPEVDHFIPWSRHPNDGLANYVLAHANCNGSKSDHIAATEHLSHWLERNHDRKSIADLSEIAEAHRWELRLEESVNIAKVLYLHLRPEIRLWRDANSQSQADLAEVRKVVGMYA